MIQTIVVKKNSFIAVSLTKNIFKKYCQKGKPCFCRTIVGPIWKNKTLRKKLISARDNLKDLCSRKSICKRDRRFVAFSDTYFTASFLESMNVKTSKKFLGAYEFFKKGLEIFGGNKKDFQEISKKYTKKPVQNPLQKKVAKFFQKAKKSIKSYKTKLVKKITKKAFAKPTIKPVRKIIPTKKNYIKN